MVKLPPLERYVAIADDRLRDGADDETPAGACQVLYHSYVFVHPHNVRDYQTKCELSFYPSPQLTHRQRDPGKGPGRSPDVRAGLRDCHPAAEGQDPGRARALQRPPGAGAQAHDGVFPPLKALAKEVLGSEIQEGEHDPVQDARATMAVFLAVREEYEAMLAQGGDIAPIPEWYW
ncbi:hypothetical protein A1Q1_04067 [Trichosporon asahii var. asahii CBS 2479]|uniref:Exonuclease domain-containing protein n=1 Tax=Trichosporon asahii var. asahii (strain ATCC 90039 / CBS 2479 / JCM 2466 / KCTC 7840 / NBRC 103889/ NCYC 2677 / UAMH 7654) TaxID=1186058 RepID=J6ERR2_TRIAS|nr:hypothetical protein A1Q1_04067 [Trichosporon asahii var. asahii CBS 2479]EJT47209.1 hypothetical protein A1Q1_04067 [Trichosporon asahii var. asahii CBS 2479]